jgi:ribonuclease Z
LKPNIYRTDNFTIQSIGLFGSWCLHHPTNTLFDCGDGCALGLGYRNFAVDRIMISHSHVDHVSGLLAFIGIRNRTKGDNTKPLDIYYNSDDPYIYNHIEAIEKIYPQEFLKFSLTFIGISSDQRVWVNEKTYIKTFRTQHTDWSMGFSVCDKSFRIKDGYDKKETGKLIKSGAINKDDVLERKDIIKFAYTLDNCGFNIAEIEGAHEVILDCTFLDANDRKGETHCSIAECEAIIEASKCRVAYLAHISPRYESQKIIKIENKE